MHDKLGLLCRVYDLCDLIFWVFCRLTGKSIVSTGD